MKQARSALPMRIARYLQGFLADRLNRLHEHAAAVWSDEAPDRAWAPRPDRVYRGIGAMFGHSR